MNIRWFSACVGLAFGLGGVLGAFAVEAPSAIDSDLFVYATAPNSNRGYFAVAGRLQLHQKPGDRTAMVGSFLDYQGLKSYPASLSVRNMEAPTVTIKSFNGSFVLRVDEQTSLDSFTGTVISQPKVFKKAGEMHFTGNAHVEITVILDLMISERLGHIALPDFEVDGSVTLTYDANGRISGGTTESTDSNGKHTVGKVSFSGRYDKASPPSTYFQAKIGGMVFNISGGFDGGDFSGFAVSGAGTASRIWVVDGTEVP